MTKSTKIVATISDKRCDVDFVRELYIEGMNVVRMNSAHLDKAGFYKNYYQCTCCKQTHCDSDGH